MRDRTGPRRSPAGKLVFVSTTPTRPHETSPGTPQLAPLPDGYGPDGRSEWLDVNWREHLRSATVAGSRVNYVEMGSGPPLVFIHGLAGCWQNWLENIPHFARRHRVIAVDLPGFGESELPLDDITIPGYGRFVDAFLGEIGVERAPLVGNSMGGFIAAEAALSHPSRVDTARARVGRGPRDVCRKGELALVKRARSPVPLRQRRAPSRAGSTGCAGAGCAAPSCTASRRHPDLLQPELCYEIASGAGKPGFLDAFGAIFDYDFRDRLSDVKHPTLIVWGRHDQIVPVAGAHEYERLIDGSRKEIFDDTGHVPMIERPHALQRAARRVRSDAARSARDRAQRRGRHRARVLRHHALLVLRRRRLPRRDAAVDLVLRQVQLEAAVVDVELDRVAVAHRRDRAAVRRLRRDVAGHQAAGRAGEAAVREQRHRVAQPLAHQRRGDEQHLAHARARRSGPRCGSRPRRPARSRPAVTASIASSSHSNTRAGPRCVVRS